MARQRHPAVAREGWPLITLAVIATAAAWFFESQLTLLAGALAFALVFKFRDPERIIPSEPLGVVSPVDGIVELVETVPDPALNRTAVRIRIRVSFFGAYSGRAPVEGKVLDLAGPRGMRLQTDEGDDVILYINTAPGFACPKSIVGYGSRVGQGQRCGWLRLARVAEVYLPADAHISVAPGRRVLAGADLLGVLTHPSA
ncbi:MAG: phosphatidylserine decarboxylase [Gammaproteobacteria bacterium]